jgi:hypothetical protein
MSFSRLLQSIILAVAMAALLSAHAAEKKRVEKEADIPRFSYAIATPLISVVRDAAEFERVVRAVRIDIESVLAQYDIADKSAQRRRLSSVAQIDFILGNYDAALSGAEAVRALEEKPADKLLSGLRLRAMVSAFKQTGELNTPAYFAAVGKTIRAELDGLPYDVIANDVKNYKAGAELLGEGRVLGNVRDVLQPTLDKTGALSSDLAPDLIGARYVLVTALPLKQTLIRTYTEYLDQHKVEKTDIWAARQINLPTSGVYTPVIVSVWDGGVDSKLFPSQLQKNATGNPAVIAFDLNSRPTNGELFPIPAALQPKLPEMLARTKGFSDLRSNIDSPEASEVKQYMSGLAPDEYKSAMEQLGLSGNFVHGTHVAGIVVNGNPWARLVIARLSYGYKLLPDPCPSLALAKRNAKANQAFVDFFKRNKVRVVNMSWGGTLKGEEESLELCGIGKNAVERQKLARQYFDIEKHSLTKAFASAPDILFITSAGNSNEDASFAEAIPSSIVLPNLLTVGAVDKAGDEAPFTSYGPTVLVHANGYQVESYLPGGRRVALSGTSMAAPNVANLAAKLLVVKPSLKPEEVIAIIRETANKTEDGRRVLINPAKALALVQNRETAR